MLTHGHEDHIGAIQYLMRDGDGIGDLRDDPLPVYGSALALGLARNRIEEAGLMPKIDMRPVTDGEQIDIGSLLVEFIPVTHSVPHAHAIAVHTAQGVVLHSGDFKIDLTPVDERRADLARIGQLAKNEGIRLLMSDSTNAEEPGYAPSETNVGGVLRGAVRAAARPADHHGELREPHPPDPADRRCCGRGGPQGRNARSEHEEEHPARPRPRRVPDPRVVADRHRGHRPLRTRRDLHHLDRIAGRADVGARPDRAR